MVGVLCRGWNFAGGRSGKVAAKMWGKLFESLAYVVGGIMDVYGGRLTFRTFLNVVV